MCDEEVMSLIAEKLGSDLIVIPSSIHETIILKETENVSLSDHRILQTAGKQGTPFNGNHGV